ncbi:hypothetical protein MLD38_006301 [Melastoma candidum]|uniref:Uncharacterized protein n=1 Tax=Melastoma candidum TaxID=119954 RepID=A0ACB9RRM2_9MYRT|nr:hypothetical protein MLD38_006301 [Melastoma candidum]
MSSSADTPLFETRRARATTAYRALATSMFVGICLIWTYRATHMPEGWIRWAWLGMMASELWFGMYWVFTQASRWSPVYRQAFKDRLSLRYGEDELPPVDIYVCTADPAIEPPVMVINTVLSVMCYDYPTRKLSVYLSDDGGSDITYYAMLEASEFARSWIPYCKKYGVEPRSPAAFFRLSSSSSGAVPNDLNGGELLAVKELYEAMKSRIEAAHHLGRVPEEVLRSKHKEFSAWDSFVSRHDHGTILQILIDNTNPKALDIDGNVLPTLVYLAREKRPQHFHNFKAGAMNVLLRVSSGIGNAPIILNVDCDMYSNNSGTLREALCFFLDEENGRRIAYVQCPQVYENVTRNEIYASSLKAILHVEFPGMDGLGGVLYIGSGCFHRRDVLCGKRFTEEDRFAWQNDGRPTRNSIIDLDELKKLADCQSERNTQWGKEMGLIYGCPVEDVITGLSIKCKGWKSLYYNPEKWAFIGLAPITLLQTLVQHKRWSEGDFQIFLSKYCPVWYGAGKIRPGLIMGYLVYLLWAPNCLATIFYAVIPSLFILNGQSLFPEVSSLWFIPYTYVAAAKYGYSLVEHLQSDGTVLSWWNEQRIWLYKRTTSYLFATIDSILMVLGFSETAFVVSPKVADPNVSKRYEKDIMEFGAMSPMFTILTTIALINAICFIWAAIKASTIGVLSPSVAQVILSGVLVLINLPIYQGIIRKDEGKMPSSTTASSLIWAVTICVGFALLS